MRALHRDIGYFFVGLIFIYVLSGVVLVYRDTDYFKRETQITKTLSPDMDAKELGRALRIKGFEVTDTQGDVVHFKDGSYNKATGEAVYTKKELPWLLQKFVGMHKAASEKLSHVITLVFAAMLCFMAVSAFWMYPRRTPMFRRGVYIAVAGGILTVLLLLLI